MSEKPVNNSMTQLELCNFLTTSELNKKFLHILFGVTKTKIPTVCLVDVALLIKRTLLTLSTSKIFTLITYMTPHASQSINLCKF